MEIFIGIILLFCIFTLLISSSKIASWILFTFGTGNLFFAGYLNYCLLQTETLRFQGMIFPNINFYLDKVGGYFLLLQSVIVFAISFYNLDFVKRAEEQKYKSKSKVYHASLIGFVAAMNLVIMSENFGMMWVFVELSTLLSALLIAHHTSTHAYEATWKYVFICSIGIAFAFTGIIFLLIGTHGDLNINTMVISQTFPVRLAIPFLIIGFGTKVGLAPSHNWLPDAHSEAPTPVSALLSASLLNCAMLILVRLMSVLNKTNLGIYASNILLIMGFLSIAIPGIFIFKSQNYKRMLAYSSIENMGISAIALAIGCMNGFLIHVVGHSLIKCALFLTAGNILSMYGTKQVSEVKDLLFQDKTIAYTWLLGILAIAGFVPFMLFASEFIILVALFKKSIILSILFLLLLTLVIYGLIKNTLMMLGKYNEGVVHNDCKKVSVLAKAPAILLLILAGIGLFMVFLKWGMIYG